MTPELLKDSEWSSLLAMADPAMDPLGEQASKVRRSVNFMFHVVYWGYHGKKRPSDGESLFASYADAGERFIRGMRAIDTYLYASGSLLDHYFGLKIDVRSKSTFDSEFAEKVKGYCEIFRVFDKALMGVSGDDEKLGPNSKPWLHFGVAFLYDLWRDELGQGERPKKDFLAFAHAVLEPLKVGITKNSVLESFDRHANANKDHRTRLRRLGPI